MPHLCSQCQSTCLGYRPSELEPSLDLDRLLAINDPPAASQEENFRSKRIDGVKRISELEIIIKELRRTLDSAMVERDAHAREVERHRLVLNPVRRLPADILREIFLYACSRSTKNPSYFYQIPPTLIAAVCRSWNHAAVTFPQLWRQFKFVIPSDVVQASDDKANLLSGLSFLRSATCPLWLDLTLSDLSYSSPSYPFLLSISGRIQRIRISTRDARLLESPEFRHLVHSMNTALVEMDLCIPANSAFVASAPLSLPRTRNLVITPYAALCSPQVGLNWSHLENLVLRAGVHLGRGDASIRSTLNILAKVPNLRRLTFSDDQCATGHGAEGDSLPAPKEPITIPHLTDLVIENCRSAIGRVVLHLSTPCVQRVTHIERLHRVNGMFYTPCCTLRHLTFQIRGNNGVRVYLGRHYESLRELSLLGVHDSQAVTGLKSFLEPLGALRVLVLDISSVSAFTMQSWEPVADAILEILESRRILPGASDSYTAATSKVELESFTLHAPLKEVFDFTDAQYERIKALRASGLLFHICRYAKKDPRWY